MEKGKWKAKNVILNKLFKLSIFQFLLEAISKIV